MALLPDSTKKLGFGLMRLPVLGGSDEAIDLEQVNQMVDHFLEQGFTYFDTAYPYHMGYSERVVKSALVERPSRNSWKRPARGISISICCMPWARTG